MQLFCMFPGSRKNNGSLLKLLALISTFAFCFGQRTLCATFCRFRLCQNIISHDRAERPALLLLCDADVAIHPAVCTEDKDGPQLTNIAEYGESFVRPLPRRWTPVARSSYVPISKYSPLGLDTPYAADYFKLLPITYPSFPEMMGLARGKTFGNQEKFVNQIYIYIPLHKYTITGTDGVATTVTSPAVSKN